MQRPNYAPAQHGEEVEDEDDDEDNYYYHKNHYYNNSDYDGEDGEDGDDGSSHRRWNHRFSAKEDKARHAKKVEGFGINKEKLR